MDKRQSMPYLPFLCPYFVLIIYYPYTPLSEKRETSKSGSKTIQVGLCNFIMSLIYLMPISFKLRKTAHLAKSIIGVEIWVVGQPF